MKQLQLLRENYANTAAFAADLLATRLLQKQGRLVCHVLKPLHEEYTRDLAAHSKGQTSVLYWHGDRCSGLYYREMVVKTLGLLKDTGIIPLLGLRHQPTVNEHIMDPDDPTLAEDTKLMQQYVDFAVELSANRCWSQSFWTMLLPYCTAGLYATQMADRIRCQTLCKRLAGSLLKLEDLIKKSPTDAGLIELRDRLGTADWVLVREFLQLGENCQGNPDNPELRLLLFTLYAGPGSTKDSLESCFNFLKDSARSSKSKKMSPYTKFFLFSLQSLCEACWS